MSKVLFSFILLFVLASNFTMAQGLSQATMTGIGDGQGVTFIDPHTGLLRSVPGVTVVGSVDGHLTVFYCIDIARTLSFPDVCHIDSAVADPHNVYILNNYYPYNPSPVGMLPLSWEITATQLAHWHYSDGVDVNTVTDATLRTRALEIIADADANGGATVPFPSISIKSSASPDDFHIETVDQNGVGIPIDSIVLTISDGGVLSTYLVSTSASGISPDVTVLVSGLTITATAMAVIPQGITYTCSGSQRMLLAMPVIGKWRAQVQWGASPVELVAFSSMVNSNTVTLNWTTESEFNNAVFEIERSEVSQTWNTVGTVQGNGTTNNQHTYSWTDRNLISGIYKYRMKQIDFNGNFKYYQLQNEIGIGVPVKFTLMQNYPNPFNPATNISYTISANQFVSLKIYDMTGKEISTVVNEQQTAGYYSISFNASALSSGMYYYTLQAGQSIATKKMMLVK